MNLETLITLLPSRKGSFVTVETSREVSTKKSFTSSLVKLSKFQLRVGHNYYAQLSTRLAHESGERAKVEASKLWHAKSELHPALSFHKTTGQLYLVGQPIGNPSTSTFFLNGEKVEKEEVESFLLASEKKTSNSDWKFVKIEDIVSIH
jgi:hypothetical protein